MDVIRERWNDFRSTDDCQRLYSSMPNRLQEVIFNNGNWCSY